MTKNDKETHHQLNQPIEIDGRLQDEIIPPLHTGAQDFFLLPLCINLLCSICLPSVAKVWASHTLVLNQLHKKYFFFC